MSDIFISWCSPDKDAVLPLVRRLHDLGLDYFEYTDQMRSGRIVDRVLEEIHKAKLALMCISDETLVRDWFSKELDWCYSDKKDDKHPMKTLILVGVRQLNLNGLPDLIKEETVYDLTLPSTYEKNLTRLIKEIYQWLGYPDPLVMGATILAMTHEDCTELSQFQVQLDQLNNLYKEAGIGHLEDWIGSFPLRYGHTPEAFAPFFNEKSIKDIVHDILRHINQGRPKTAPIFIKWYDRKLLVATSKEGDRVRDEWLSQCQIIIIDAVSLLIKKIADDFASILQFPSPKNTQIRRALAWIPPFTRHAKYLHELIAKINEKPVALRHLLNVWQKEPDCDLSFDTATNVSLRRWLNSVLRDLASPQGPVASNLAEIEEHYGKVGLTPAKMYRPTP